MCKHTRCTIRILLYCLPRLGFESEAESEAGEQSKAGGAALYINGRLTEAGGVP